MFVYCLSDDDVRFDILPVVDFGEEPVAAAFGIFRFGNVEHLVEQEPLVFDGVGLGEFVGDVEGGGQRTSVGRPYVEGDGEFVVLIGEFSESVERGLDEGLVGRQFAALHFEIERHGIFHAGIPIVQHGRSGHA